MVSAAGAQNLGNVLANLEGFFHTGWSDKPDPRTDKCGHTHDLATWQSIEKAAQAAQTQFRCPHSGEPIDLKELYPNLAFKSVSEQLRLCQDSHKTCRNARTSHAYSKANG